MSTETITISPNVDIDAVLRSAFPLGARLITKEGGMPIFLIGARAMMTSPHLAAEALHPAALRRWGTALQALGQQHQAVGERMVEMAEQKASEKNLTP